MCKANGLAAGTRGRALVLHVRWSLPYREHTWLVCVPQLPGLKDLQRVIDELAFGVGTPASQGPTSSLIVEQVSR